MTKLNNLDTTVSSRASQDSLNTLAKEIKERLEKQQADLMGQISEHDTDIKEQLQALEARLEVLLINNGEKTEEVIRLVKTPEGQRRK